MSNDTVAVCPDCDSTKIQTRKGHYDGQRGYSCNQCYTFFEKPVERERKHAATDGCSGGALAAALADADADAVGGAGDV